MSFNAMGMVIRLKYGGMVGMPKVMRRVNFPKSAKFIHGGAEVLRPRTDDAFCIVGNQEV